MCSHSLSERRKLLDYFSSKGERVVLYGGEETALNVIDGSVQLIIVNVFDSNWSVVDWVTALSDKNKHIPIVFVHDDEAQIRSSHDLTVNRLTHVNHLTQHQLLALPTLDLSALFAGISPAHAQS